MKQGKTGTGGEGLTLGKGIYRTKQRRGSFLKFYFEVIRLMQSGSRGTGFTENVSELMVVWWNASHVDWGIIGSCFVRKKGLVDLVIIHFREMGEGYCVDKGNFQSNERSQSQRVG